MYTHIHTHKYTRTGNSLSVLHIFWNCTGSWGAELGHSHKIPTTTGRYWNIMIGVNNELMMYSNSRTHLKSYSLERWNVRVLGIWVQSLTGGSHSIAPPAWGIHGVDSRDFETLCTMNRASTAIWFGWVVTVSESKRKYFARNICISHIYVVSYLGK